MQLTLIPYHLLFKHPFKIAHGVRTGTPVVYVKVQHMGLTAWGEATLPPYLPETQQSVIDFITAFSRGLNNSSLEAWFEKLNADTTANRAAKAALDMALWHLKAQLNNTTIGALLAVNNVPYPYGTYTLGVSTPAEMQIKINEGLQAGFEVFKLKLDGHRDEDVITTYQQLCNKPFAVDVNQGWPDAVTAIKKINWLQQKGCLLVEQPLNKLAVKEMTEVKSQTSLPVYADESCQTIEDIAPLAENFAGVNIKLMKCGGISPAIPIIEKARQLGLQILIGCMSESSVGCTAAAHLTPLANYADLDGPYLIANDPFTGMKIKNGLIGVNELQSIRDL